MIPELTLLVHTRNSADSLPKLLATTNWAAERIIVDMDSCDETRELAEKLNCRVVQCAVEDVVDNVRNAHLGEVKTPWTLVLDSDEYLAADAEDNIKELIETHGQTHDAFALPRYNRIGETILSGSGWYPDHQIRLFKTGQVSWGYGLHRMPTVLGGKKKLMKLDPKGAIHIHHDNYTDLTEVISKQLWYATIDEYDTDPANFDFSDYIAMAYREYNHRFDPKADGELAKALATIMAWNCVVKGLIHWDRLGRQNPLPSHFSLPVAAMREPPKTQIRRDGREVGRLKQKFKKWLRRIRNNLRGR